MAHLPLADPDATGAWARGRMGEERAVGLLQLDEAGPFDRFTK